MTAEVVGVPISQGTFALSGVLGALIMFVADLVLYFPMMGDDAALSKQHRTAASYFATIDPGGNNLANSSMQYVGNNRVMLGGVMGPISAVFYTIGFLGSLILSGWGDDHDAQQWDWWVLLLLPRLVAGIGLSLMMTIAAVYHALFAYTCFLSKEIAKQDNTTQQQQQQSGLHHILQIHQTYLRYIYKWAAASGMIGSLAWVYCCLTTTITPRYSIFFVPVMSGPIKKLLKKYNWGGIVLCGGLTNLWNLCFFVILYHASP